MPQDMGQQGTFSPGGPLPNTKWCMVLPSTTMGLMSSLPTPGRCWLADRWMNAHSGLPEPSHVLISFISFTTSCTLL